VRQRAVAARDAARSLVNRSVELRADVALQEAEAARYALWKIMLPSPKRRGLAPA
jgi:hypothetical protein